MASQVHPIIAAMKKAMPGAMRFDIPNPTRRGISIPAAKDGNAAAPPIRAAATKHAAMSELKASMKAIEWTIALGVMTGS